MNYRLILGKLRSELWLLRLQICNHTKNVKQFFPKKDLITPHYIFQHYIHILIIHCILLSKQILRIPKITSQNTKNVSQFLKKNSPAVG